MVFIAATWFWYSFMPMRHHWPEIFRPAVYKLLSFQSPYLIDRFFNPPWALIPLLPFALLPERLGWSLLAVTTFFVLGFVAHRMGAKWWMVMALLLLPHTLYNGLQVNVDWLAALGFIMPPQIGLFFILLKPQLGAPLALFWLIETWRTGGWRKAIKIFAPVTTAFLISFLIYDLYITRSTELILQDGKSFWPFSIPIGVILLFLSIRSRKPALSIFSAPFLSPYTQPYSWPYSLLGLINRPKIFLVFILIMWIIQDRDGPWMLRMILAPFFD